MSDIVLKDANGVTIQVASPAQSEIALADAPSLSGITLEDAGLAGPQGADGAPGSAGAGVPVGGTAGQVLSKIDATDYNTQWVAQSGGGGGGGAVDSVNSQTGVVVLDQDDIGDGTTYKQYSATDKSKVGFISVTQAVDLDAIETNANNVPAIKTKTDFISVTQPVDLDTMESDIAAKQPLDSDLTAIAGLDSSASGSIASDGAGWIKKTYAQLKTALGLVKADVGLGNVDNTADASKTFTESQITGLVSDLANKQPLDSDLTTIAGLTATTDNFMVATASAWASRTPSQARTQMGLGSLATASTITASLISDASAAGQSMITAANATAQTALLNSFVGDSGAGGTKGMVPAPATGDSGKFLKGNGTWAALAGGGDALTANPLSQFASTTSAQLFGVISDGTGTGKLVFDTTPTLSSVSLAAGTATAGTAPLKLTAGTLLTTAEDGAIEMDADAFYATSDAGNRGVIPVEHFIRADATRTFTSNTAQQAIFNSPTNGTLTLETGTYLFEALVSMDTMSATSGNGKFSLNSGGTATLAAILYQAYAQDVAVDTVGAISGLTEVTSTQVAANIATAATAAVLTFMVKGTFEVSVAGTIIPSFAQTTAAAAVVKIGSYFRCNRIGSTSVTNVGQWS